MIDMNYFSERNKNEKLMTGLITISSKNNNFFVGYTFIQENANTGEVLAISKKVLGTQVTEN